VDTPSASEPPAALTAGQPDAAVGDPSASSAGKEAEGTNPAASETSALDKTADFFKRLPRYCLLQTARHFAPEASPERQSDWLNS
jgi:hypothetical protein